MQCCVSVCVCAEPLLLLTSLRQLFRLMQQLQWGSATVSTAAAAAAPPIRVFAAQERHPGLRTAPLQCGSQPAPGRPPALELTERLQVQS